MNDYPPLPPSVSQQYNPQSGKRLAPIVLVVLAIGFGAYLLYMLSGWMTQTLGSIVLSPSFLSLVVGGNTGALAAACLDQKKVAMTCPDLTWASDARSIAVVSAGTVKPARPGTAHIAASSGWVTSNNSTVTVRASGVGSPTLLQPSSNSSYFADQTGNAVLLVGSHTWFNVQNWSACRSTLRNAPNITNFDAYLDYLVARGHNFTRLWVWENARWDWNDCDTKITPELYPRSATAGATAGGNKFDLSRVSTNYLDELEGRVSKAYTKDIYVSVMFFQGLSVGSWNGLGGAVSPDSMWKGHPYYSGNNVSSVDGGSENGWTTQTCTTGSCASDPVLITQQAYVSAVVNRLSRYPNVIWEIGNETNPGSQLETPPGNGSNSPWQGYTWQYYWVDYIHSYERSHAYLRHPVWITPIYNGYYTQPMTNMTNSNAEAVAPSGPYWATDPPVNTFKRIVIADSDHVDMDSMSPMVVFKQFTRGYNIAIMDDMGAGLEASRMAAGDVRAYSVRMNLKRAVPWDNRIAGAGKCSTGYCLVDDGTTYLQLYPAGGSGSLTTAAGTYNCEWWNVNTRAATPCGAVTGAGPHTFNTPASPAVLFLYVQAAATK